MRVPLWASLAVWLLAAGCSPGRYLRNQVSQAEKDFQNHIGFFLYDPQTRKTLLDYQGDRYFIPASNTKIFTLYACLQLLGDSIPSLKYLERNDSLILWATGDPSFLYDKVTQENRTYSFLRQHSSSLYMSSPTVSPDRFGPGWSWDDYSYAYQVERTTFPIYGNRFRVSKANGSFQISPAFFRTDVAQTSTSREKHELVRDPASNALVYAPGSKSNGGSTWNIPVSFTDGMMLRLLSDTLHREIKSLSMPVSTQAAILYSVPSDSLYRVMMQQSDNFLAEQLLIVCAGILSDTLKPEIAIREAQKRFLEDLPDPPVWVDGSGLSRMNLATPRSVVRMWEKIDAVVPRGRLYAMLAAGGMNGTLQDYYIGGKPFLYGKTGTLRNNNALSGFLITRRGRTLLFSWMNNNFTSSTGDVRKRMETVLKFVYEKY